MNRRAKSSWNRCTRQRARENRPDYKEGRKNFGFRGGEPETVNRILELRNSDMTLVAISSQLTEEKLRPDSEGCGNRAKFLGSSTEPRRSSRRANQML